MEDGLIFKEKFRLTLASCEAYLEREINRSESHPLYSVEIIKASVALNNIIISKNDFVDPLPLFQMMKQGLRNNMTKREGKKVTAGYS